MNNPQIAEVFEDIAGLLEMKDEPGFTVRAYQRVVRTIEHLPTELEQMVREERDLREIPGVGKAISDKITELVKTGKLKYYENLRAEFPEGILEVIRVPGVGPKTTKRLWQELGVGNISDLESAGKDGRLASLPRLGEKTAQNILRSIELARKKTDRVPIARALPAAERVMAALRERCGSIRRLVAAGSLRRFEETIGDVDLVCTAADAEEVLEALVGLPNVTRVLGHGGTKASVVLSEGIQVDLRVVEDAHFGPLLQYFTGDQQHNIRLRERAGRMGLSVNEYGITDVNTGQIEMFPDEESLYERLGLQYIPPEIRQGMSEIEVAARGELPRLLEISDIKGDLHVHTDWSDGREPAEVMIAAAKDRGLEYVAITDHSVGRGIANGLSEERLDLQLSELRQIESRIGGIKVLAGTEMDIRADGSLDYPDRVLKNLDWVIGSVHSAMNQDAAKMTERIITAMRNPQVTAIGHLTTRLIGQREPIDADFEALFRAAADTGTALEINASPERLDLKDTHIYRARDLGVPLVISTDAHEADSLDNTGYGVAIARRGWCESKHILNTLRLDEFVNFLGLEKSRRTKAFAGHE